MDVLYVCGVGGKRERERERESDCILDEILGVVTKVS